MRDCPPFEKTFLPNSVLQRLPPPLVPPEVPAPTPVDEPLVPELLPTPVLLVPSDPGCVRWPDVPEPLAPAPVFVPLPPLPVP